MSRRETIEAIFQNWEALARVVGSRKLDPMGPRLPTHAQVGVMLVLQHERLLSVKGVAERFRMTSSAATQLINGLVKDGLVRRQEDPKDRRIMCVALTAKGHKVLAEARKCRMENLKAIMEILSDSELVQLEKIQRKLVERLQALWTQHQKN